MARPPANWPPPPHYPPPHYPPAPPRRRRLPVFVGGVAVGAAVAAAVTAALTAQTGPDPTAAAPVTVTAPPSASPSAPLVPVLTTAEADRQTCQAYSDASVTLRSARDALQIIPADMTILAPEVRVNATWSAAVQRAAALYGQAATTQANGIAAGSTVALHQSANTFSGALQAMDTAYRTYDAAVGDIYAAGQASAGAMSVLCNRLAPR